MHKRALAIVIICLSVFLLTCATVVAINEYRPLEKAGENYAGSTQDRTNAIAKVNGAIIPKTTFKASKTTKQAVIETNRELLRQTGEDVSKAGVMPSDAEILQSLIEREVLVQEAVKCGITVADSEIEELFAIFDEAYASGDEGAVQAYNALSSFAAGMGMTYETYRKEIEYGIQYRDMMIQKLQQQFVKDNFNIESRSQQNIERITEAYQEYVEGLLNEANIEMMQ